MNGMLLLDLFGTKPVLVPIQLAWISNYQNTLVNVLTGIQISTLDNLIICLYI